MYPVREKKKKKETIYDISMVLKQNKTQAKEEHRINQSERINHST